MDTKDLLDPQRLARAWDAPRPSADPVRVDELTPPKTPPLPTAPAPALDAVAALKALGVELERSVPRPSPAFDTLSSLLALARAQLDVEPFDAAAVWAQLDTIEDLLESFFRVEGWPAPAPYALD